MCFACLQLREHSAGCRVLLAHEHRSTVAGGGEAGGGEVGGGEAGGGAQGAQGAAAAAAADATLQHLVATAAAAGLAVRRRSTTGGARPVSLLDVTLETLA